VGSLQNTYGASQLTETKVASEIIVEHFSQIIFFPFRLAFGGAPHNQTAFSFDDVSNQLLRSPGTGWRKGNCRIADIKTRFGPPIVSEHWPDLQHAQAHAYFHPFIRQFLFDNRYYDNDYRIAFHRTDIDIIRVQLGGRMAFSPPVMDEKPKPRILKFKVKRCELEVVRMGVGLLILEVEAVEPLQLDVVQAVQNQLRRNFSPFFDDGIPKGSFQVSDPMSSNLPRLIELLQIGADKKVEVLASTLNPNVNLVVDGIDSHHNTEFLKRFAEPLPQTQTPETGRLPKTAQSYVAIEPDAIPVNAHWEYLLKPLLGRIKDSHDKLRFIPLGDDRLPIMTYIAVKEPREIKRGDWVRLCFADNPGFDSLPYAGKFLKNFEDDFCYDRYWYSAKETTDKPSRILNSGMTFCWIGSSDCEFFFSNPKNGALATFRTIYSRIGLLAHLQKAALLTVSSRISELSSRSNSAQVEPPKYLNDKHLIDRFYREFIEFTHVYWFDEVTPQMQGIEIFSAWQNHLNVRPLHDEVRQELIDLTNVIKSAQEEIQSQQASDQTKETIALSAQTLRLTNYAIGFGALSFAVGFFGMNFFSLEASNNLFKLNVPLGFDGFKANLPKLAMLGLLIFLTSAVAFGSVWLVNWILGFFKNKKP
jgi:hypothetical protein